MPLPKSTTDRIRKDAEVEAQYAMEDRRSDVATAYVNGAYAEAARSHRLYEALQDLIIGHGAKCDCWHHQALANYENEEPHE